MDETKIVTVFACFVHFEPERGYIMKLKLPVKSGFRFCVFQKKRSVHFSTGQEVYKVFSAMGKFTVFKKQAGDIN